MNIEQILEYTKKLTLMIESGNLLDMELALGLINGSIKEEPKILENLKKHFESFPILFSPGKKEQEVIYKEILGLPKKLISN